MTGSQAGRTSLTHRLRKRFVVLASIPAGLGWLAFGGISAAGQGIVLLTCPLETIANTPSPSLLTKCLAVGAEEIGATEGKAFTGKEVARFIDNTATASGTGYTATIDWGDGSAATDGTVAVVYSATSKEAVGTVKGSHTYDEEGSNDFTVTVKHGTVQKDDTNTATVDDAAIHITATGSGTEGAASDALIATFKDDNPNAVAADFTVEVVCDNEIGRPNKLKASLLETALPTISKNGDHFDVHFCRYSEEGIYPTFVGVTDKDGKAGDQALGTVDVANAALSVTQTFNQTTSEFGLIDGETLANFADANGAPDSQDFSAAIDWGDGSTADATGSIGGNATDGFTVNGSHSYDEGGTYTVTVTITDNRLGTGNKKTTTTATLTATVTDKALAVTGKTATSSESASTGMVTIATFTDANNDESISKYSATIDWKDGSAVTTCSSTSTTCPITFNDTNSNFEIKSSHTYAEENSDGYKPHVTVSDEGGASAAGDATVKVNDAALTASNGQAFNAQQGQTTGNVVTATFTDANTPKDKTDFTASINWGDSQTSAGTVSLADNGTFSVTGTHTYTGHGSFTVTTTITDTGGKTASATAAASVAKTVTLAQTGGSWLLPPEAGPYAFGGGLLLILGVLGWLAVIRDRFVWSSKRLR